MGTRAHAASRGGRLMGAATLAVTVVVHAGAPAGAAPATGTAAGTGGQVAGPLTVTVDPAAGAAIDDTLTVTVAGVDPAGQPGLSVAAALCAEAPFPDGHPFSWEDLATIDHACAEPRFAGVGAGGGAVVELPVTTARATIVWVGLPDLATGGPAWRTASVPVAVEPPAAGVRLTVDDSQELAGWTVRATATFDGAALPSGPVDAARCDAAVLADPSDAGLVADTCTFTGAPQEVDLVGELVTDVPVAAGTGAVWVGGTTAVGFAGAARPVDVADPSVTVAPATDLADGQVVTVTADDLRVPMPGVWWVAQCEAAVLDRLPDASLALGGGCADPLVVDADAAGDLTTPLTIRRTIEVTGPVSTPRTVDCGAAADACAVVVYGLRSGPDTQEAVGAGAPISLAAARPPVVVPGAVGVIEGDEGAVTARVPVTLSAPSATPVTVAYTTFDPPPTIEWAATSGADFVPTAGTLTFDPGETDATIELTVVGDTEPEGLEMALVGLTDPVGATLGGFGGIGGVVISDDDTSGTEREGP